MPRAVFAGVRFACMAGAIAIASATGLHASTLRFSPAPARAGQAITVAFTSLAITCSNQGTMEVHSIQGATVVLRVSPAECYEDPCCLREYIEYTAETSIGPLAAGTYRVEVYEDPSGRLLESRPLEVQAATACASTATQLCLADSRFAVTASWRDFAGRTGAAQTVPDRLGGLGNHGQFSFFTTDNPELLVKILDGCALNGRYWVLVSPGSNIEYEVIVRDLRGGATRTYFNPLHSFHALFADTDSFPCAAP